MSFHRRTTDACKGKWKGILLTLGLPESCLKDKHGRCPLCDGKDKFRWDNKDGRGTYICTCGAGDGMALAIAYTGREFSDLAREIDGMVGNVKADAPARPQMTTEDRRQGLINVYRATQPVEPGDLVDKYLGTRGLDELTYPPALRFAPKLRDGEGGIRPAMIAMIHAPCQEKAVSMHRTFLRADGLAKAEMKSPRKLMPGELPDGACVRLGECGASGVLGIAEGIETAMSASTMFNIPVWAAISTKILEKWIPPAGCEEVIIFGDNDPKFGGQSAAFRLAHKLAVRGFEVSVKMPDRVGQDWNDEMLIRYGKGAA